MPVLSRKLRRTLESTVKAARREAEAGAKKALEHLAVHNPKFWDSLTSEQRTLRQRLRAHGKQLGDRRDGQKNQEISRLTAECAYEHWHRMLFARFLAESDLLVEPETGVALTLDECRELARERGIDWLELASSFATRMLPQIFRVGDPLLEVELPPETRSELEKSLETLPQEVFLADDSLGWVYQFWQAERKEEVNRSETKIGAEELPAVTQLFTEDYMVLFLLHNTLGAWWAGKVLATNPELASNAANESELRAVCRTGDIDWNYLRFVREEGKPWRPAAGNFDGWPKTARELTILDPCMGSGHFLVFALFILMALRIAEEGMSESAAAEAVLRDNLHGLEIDLRCTQIAAFNLALAAWRKGGYRLLPRLHLACCGLAPQARKEDWLKLSLGIPRLNLGMERLYSLFELAPLLGSLIDPRQDATLQEAGHKELAPLLDQALAQESTDDTFNEIAITAQGIAKATELLAGQYSLVMTNFPYLGHTKHHAQLREFCATHYPTGKWDLYTTFMQRSRSWCGETGELAVVSPAEWTFLKPFVPFRSDVLRTQTIRLGAKLGFGAFSTPIRVNPGLWIICFSPCSDTSTFGMVDVSSAISPNQKQTALMTESMNQVHQLSQLRNPDSRILAGDSSGTHELLINHATALTGLSAGDSSMFDRLFWEVQAFETVWEPTQSSVSTSTAFGGRSGIVRWEEEKGLMAKLAESVRHLNHAAQNWRRGKPAWGREGVAISLMGKLAVTRYTGQKYDINCCAIIPKERSNLPALWAFAESGLLSEAVRRIDQSLKLAPHTLLKIPFNLTYWRRKAEQQHPAGLPKPHSDDPTQWLFNGYPKGSENPLQVALARLLGYRWPRQAGLSLQDCPALGTDGLERHSDSDGIVALTTLRGEAPAAERLIALLADAYGPEWSAAKLANLLAEAGFEGKTLDDWLRDGFFSQHCEFFQHRPFIWHVWDGRRDGFHALVNYHRLAGSNGEGKRVFENLLYAYLGGWIDRQQADQRAGVEGADGRLAAAEHLKGELEKILAGEPPYDIFVRWKPLHEQAIGWEPDIDDGVRLNIRPFMTARPLNTRSRGACILRSTPRIKWDKDRGKEPNRLREDFPWFWSCDGASTDFPGGREFDGNRWNDLHYSRFFKEAARSRKGSGR